MYYLIGLGNQGKKYQNNRHNVGHQLINYLKTRNINIKLLKTDCFMNQSGNFIKKVVDQYKLKTKELIIAHDDLDIPLGSFKIQKGVGPKVHNGLISIEKTLKIKDFWRIRIGIDNRLPENYINGETYVLENFLPDEINLLKNQVFSKILERLLLMIKKE